MPATASRTTRCTRSGKNATTYARDFTDITLGTNGLYTAGHRLGLHHRLGRPEGRRTDLRHRRKVLEPAGADPGPSLGYWRAFATRAGDDPSVRSIWKGAISFGLVTIPVKLYSATEERDVSFHQVHREDGGRIKYKRVCTVDGEEVSYGDIAKGYDLGGGEMVVLTDEDLAGLPLTTSRTIDVLQFVPLEQVDPIYFAKSYYLEPDRTGTKPYALLRDALEESGRVALVKVALRQREQLATLRVRDGVFVLETMLWPDEVREPDFGFLDEEISVRPQELAMAAR